MKKHILLILCYFSIQLYAQDFQFFHLNKENHLTANTSLSICKDSRGYLWIGTAYGLNRYDGNKTQHFFQKDGLNSDFISYVFEDSKQQIWIGTDNGVNIWNGADFKNVPIEYTSLLSKDIQFIKELNGEIFLGTKSSLFILGNKGFQTYMVSNTHVFSIDFYRSQYFVGTSDGLYTFNPTNNYTSVNTNVKGAIHFTKYQDDDLTCTDNYLLYKNDTLLYPFKSGVKSIIKYNKLIYIGTYGDGIWSWDGSHFHLIHSGDNTIDRTIQQLIKGSNNSLWIASNAGVTAMNEPSFISSNKEWSKEVFPIYEYNNSIYFGGKKGIYAQSEEYIQHHLLEESSRFVLCMGTNEKNQLLASGIGGEIYKLQESKFISVQTIHPSMRGRFIYDIQSNDTATFYASGNEIYYSKDKEFSYFKIDTTNGMSYDIHSNENGLWFATSNGLLHWDGYNTKRIDSKSGLPSINLKVIEEDAYGSLWLGTTSSGLIQYKNGTVKAIKDELSNPQIKSLKWDNYRNCLWVGTDNGLNRININSEGLISDIIVFNNETGFPIGFCHNKSLNVLKNGNLIFAANIPNSDEDYVHFLNDKEILKAEHQLEVFFESITANDSIIKYPYKFSHKENNINITYNAIHLLLGKHLQFQWKLNNGQWHKGSIDRNIQFHNLRPNAYRLSVRCKLPHQQWTKPSVLEFEVSPPYWKRWWFIVSLVGLFSFVIYYYTEKKAKTKLKEQQKNLHHLQKQAELELRAVRSQLNPHFLFNTLNSIQDLLLDKNEEKARLYLSDCAQLMRKVLEYSSESKISLGEELELLKKYIKLENLRFSGKIKTKWVINVDDETLIPPLILQPYIENAIKHGIQTNGEILISISKRKNYIKCIIQDNGKGFKQKIENKQSKGLKLMQERLDALNQLENTNIYQQKILPLEQGTQVEIHLMRHD